MDARTRHLLKIGLLASTLEWYEFSVYGFLAGTLGQLFFKSTSKTVALIQAFALFALSYLARPLGSLFFGLIGNRIGRNQVLKISLLLMSIPTVLIGCLPTYEQMGSLATLALLCLRLIQGFATGGELPASACYVFEESLPDSNKSLLCSSAAVGPLIGLLFGSLATSLLSFYFTQETLLAWAWRLPFWFGIPLTFVIAYLRRAIPQMPSPQRTDSKRSPWKGLKIPLLQGIVIIAFLSSAFNTLAIWMPAYLSYFLEVPYRLAHFTNTLTLCAVVAFCFMAGKLSQHYGHHKVILISTVAILLSVYPFFKGLQTATSWGVLLGLQLGLALFVCGINGTYVEMLGKLFTPVNRLLGMSLGVTLPSALIGGITPMLCSYVIHKTGWLMFPAFYIMAFGLLALPVALRLKKHGSV